MKKSTVVLALAGIVLGICCVCLSLLGQHITALCVGAAGFIASLVSLLRRATP